MKKRLGFLSLPLCLGLPVLATETAPISLTESLIHFADKEIEKGTITVDKFITTMQNIHETQKSTIQFSLEKGDINTAQNMFNQRNEMYPLTTHLYKIKAGSGTIISNASGVEYTYKLQAPLSWLNIQRGNEDYYAFPRNKTFLEVQRNVDKTGMLYQETMLDLKDVTYKPVYYYGGNNSLNNLYRKDLGYRIMEVRDENIEQYYFFDLPELQTDDLQNYTISVISGDALSGADLYEVVSYSPGYYITSLDKGLQFCQKVSDFIGEKTTASKEYSAKECTDAANGNFYKGMHTDILNYAADLYL